MDLDLFFLLRMVLLVSCRGVRCFWCFPVSRNIFFPPLTSVLLVYLLSGRRLRYCCGAGEGARSKGRERGAPLTQ